MLYCITVLPVFFTARRYASTVYAVALSIRLYDTSRLSDGSRLTQIYLSDNDYYAYRMK